VEVNEPQCIPLKLAVKRLVHAAQDLREPWNTHFGRQAHTTQPLACLFDKTGRKTAISPRLIQVSPTAMKAGHNREPDN
jgi:hypothetical protein